MPAPLRTLTPAEAAPAAREIAHSNFQSAARATTSPDREARMVAAITGARIEASSGGDMLSAILLFLGDAILDAASHEYEPLMRP
jgi:hypothetical protein